MNPLSSLISLGQSHHNYHHFSTLIGTVSLWLLSIFYCCTTMEGNRVRTEQILENLVQNQNNNQNRQGQCVSLSDFLRVGPPFFSNPKEPLDADDWLRSIQRKFAAHHVPAAEHVNFATYLLEGPAGVWWEGYLAQIGRAHV